jgi:hypothetical protein
LSTPCKATYRRSRIEENYDLEGSPTFHAWKKLYNSSQQSNSDAHRCPHASNESDFDCNTPEEMTETGRETTTESSYLGNTSATRKVLKEILIYPTLAPSGPPKTKNLKRSIPNFVSGPESMKLLLDEKLKKFRQVAEKQKKIAELKKKGGNTKQI